VVDDASRALIGASAPDNNSVAIETVGKGAPAPDQPAPRSDAPAPEATVPQAEAAPTPDQNELKPNVAADPNELKPNVGNEPTAPPPVQVNEIQPAGAGQPANGQAASDGKTDAAASSSSTADDKDVDDAMSSSKHKKKKGLRKVVPF